MSKIRFCSITKSYDKDINILKNISIDIDKQEFLVLLGPSGCGKSTLLRMLAGIEEITSGEIFIDEQCVNNVEPKDREIAMVFQNYALYPHMTVYGNMAYGLKIKKYKKDDIDKRINHAAQLLKIENLLKRYPSELSGGQKQRVAIGRAIVKEPKVFLMDEPLSNLDAKLRNEMRIEIKKLYENLNSTFIYVTHDQVEAVTLGERIAVMYEGEIVQIGTPFEVLNHPINTFVASFIGTPQINYLDGIISGVSNGADLKIENSIFHCHIENCSTGQDIIVGIRPEHCTIVETNDNTLEMNVVFIEIIGTEMLIHLKFQDKDFIIKQPLSETISKNQTVQVQIDQSKMLFFDSKTQLNLRGNL